MDPRAFRRIAVTLAGALLLSHCAQKPVAGGGDFVSTSEQQEIEMGAQAHREVLKTYAPLDNPAVQAYVAEVGQQLAQQCTHPALPWHFTVVDSPDVNAFALPGGYVYVTRGLLAYLNSEAELAAVIAHEIGHVTAHHGTGVPAPARAGGLGSVFAPDAERQPGAGLLHNLEGAWTAGYGSDQEMEADRFGADCLTKSRYDPQAMVAVLASLKNQARFANGEAKRDGRTLRTYHAVSDAHPGSDARLAEAVGEHVVAHPREGRGTYLKKIAGIYFGDSPDQGAIRGNRLLHEKFGLALAFPQGWRVENRAGGVVATSPRGDALLELRQGLKNDRPLEALQQGIKLDAGARYESGALSGYPAAFVAGAQDGKPVVAASVVFGGTQYLIAGVAQDKAAYERERSALRAAINSFRAITPAEKRAARPAVVHVIAAQDGTTMAGLARQSPLGADAERQLRLLNDLYPAGEPAPGQLIKIVQ